MTVPDLEVFYSSVKYICCYLTDQGNFISAVAITDKIRVPEADTADA